MTKVDREPFIPVDETGDTIPEGVITESDIYVVARRSWQRHPLLVENGVGSNGWKQIYQKLPLYTVTWHNK
ncbi:MAG: hypothetical protein UT39_C0026G0008 [Candidatus Woesebacteria bacterium GW2011_GWA1_39_21]|uniref:Uncharacterized protein n=1 Tax=Candidatus Woesebacteria bacterium GW2011_GWA1_39_21 TaxID=1618550 RepID=A0A0G0N375_9BACT|nr:MAG: hypothetical protein UT39_C0026G0008 [Candidatus Woesebacteria bacterium GW2011_GWA1_39_21]